MCGTEKSRKLKQRCSVKYMHHLVGGGESLSQIWDIIPEFPGLLSQKEF